MSKVGRLGTLPLRLAEVAGPPGDESGEVYQRRYIPVAPQDERIVGDRFALGAEDQVKVWRSTSWSGGEFDGPWDGERKAYRRSLRVRPTRRGDGLILGPARGAVETTGSAAVSAGAVGLTGVFVSPSARPVIGVWEPANSTLYRWDPDDEDLVVVDATEIDAELLDPLQVLALEGFGDETWLSTTSLAGAGLNGVVHFEMNPSSAELTISNVSFVPVIRWWRDRLFFLDEEDLWEVDDPDTASSSRTQRTSINPAYTIYESGIVSAVDLEEQERIVAGDVGPIWWFRTPTLDVEVWQYNAATDTQEQLATLPTKAQPTRIMSTLGFIFLGFRGRPPIEGTAADRGEAYVYYQRGSQRGVAGPFRDDHINLTSDHWYHLPVVVGLDGDELLVLWAAGLWAYNLSGGGIYHLGLDPVNDRWGYQAALQGQHVVIANSDDGARASAPATFYNLRRYTTETAWLDSGVIDFDYPALQKVLLDVTVETDPLPAATSVQVAVSVDSAAFVTLTGTHDVDGATTFTFPASTSSTTRAGKSFEIRVMLATTDPDETPTIRSVSARATGSAHAVEWVLAVDVGDVGEQASHSVIDALNGLAAAGSVVQLSDPWQNPDTETPDTFDVTVEEVLTPQERTHRSDSELVATVRLKAVTLV